MKSILESTHLHIGSLTFPELDQTDFTGPFKIFSKIPNSTYHIIGRETKPLRDVLGTFTRPARARLRGVLLGTLGDCHPAVSRREQRVGLPTRRRGLSAAQYSFPFRLR